MGRPKDKFWPWVNRSPDGTLLSCKFCRKEFTGGVSRIKKHLACVGGDIGPCEGVPVQIREEAFKAVTKKRGRWAMVDEYNNNDNFGNGREISHPPATVMATPNVAVQAVAAASSSCFNGVLSTKNGGSEECDADMLVKFLMSRNVPLEAIKDSHFWTLLTSVAKHGLQSCLLLDYLGNIQKSLSNFEHEINQYMLMVKESWKTTGCTLMLYDLYGGKLESSALVKNNVVLGFYCPKGFIFVEVDRPSTIDQRYDLEAIKNALKNHALNLSIDDVIKFIPHDLRAFMCRYGICESSDIFVESSDVETSSCAHQEVEDFCRDICHISKWVGNLIEESEEIYEFVVSSCMSWEVCKAVKQKGFIKVQKGELLSSFSRLDLIMKLEVELKSWLSRLSEQERFVLDDIAVIINKDEFWHDGNELLLALAPLLQIPHLMDTIVATGGCLNLVLDKGKDVLKTYYDRNNIKFQEIWYFLRRSIENRGFIDSMQEPTAYLNPAYILSKLVQGNHEPLLPNVYGKKRLRNIVECGEWNTLDAELKEYGIKSSNPFANISISECKANHPINLWKEHGRGFPLLQKCAIKLLSQPSSCLCNQVEKHLSQLQGSDNYILRLNAKMMEEFTKLGDNIYQPIDF